MKLNIIYETCHFSLSPTVELFLEMTFDQIDQISFPEICLHVATCDVKNKLNLTHNIS